MTRKAIAAFVALFATSVGAVDIYKLHVTRKADNLYKIDGRELYLLTSLCLELAIGQEAILRWEGHRGTLIFVSFGGYNNSCTVEAVLGRVKFP